ncbi:hypothetical protein ARMGADRAFT_64871 [Armillaria gallica]|uniref:DUF6534 domain-containing protein n=1 Tax=Armillaria gallica TaxID=47427 RepID=A0A2H3E059_ARMGA|nr:hypothetical protein ARMGADRAFT_64871 [Armillaria gallica]
MAVVHRTRSEEVALGMTLLGLIFSSILYGISLSQTYTYYRRFPKDTLSTKLMVVIMTIIDAAAVALMAHACWYYFVTTGPYHRYVWSLNAELAFSMLISGLSEGFLTYRVWLLSGRRTILTLVLLCLALVHLVSGEVAAGQSLALHYRARFGSVKVPHIIRLGSAVLCDTSLAISLCYFLHQKRTGYKQTDEIIDRLMIFSISTGLLTSFASVAGLITYLVVPKTWVYLALCFLISRLYANTFLCSFVIFTNGLRLLLTEISLNTRHILRTASDEAEESPAMPRFRSRITPRTLLAREKPPTQLDIFIVTETISDASKDSGLEYQGSIPNASPPASLNHY